MNRISRRTLIQGLGLGAAAWLLPYRRARAATPPIPTRILFVYSMGSIRSFWPPVAPPGMPAPTEAAWALGPLHQPLAGREKDLIFIDGLDMIVADIPQPGMPNGHQHGGIAAMTAATRMSDSLANGPSIDQFIAQQINSPQPVTKLPSLELSAGDTGGDVEGGPHYLAPGQIVSPERNPKAAFQRVFGDFAPPDDAGARKAAADALAQKTSVLDFAAKEFQTVAPRLASEDRVKLEAHAAAIRDLEARLVLQPMIPRSSCTPPDHAYNADLAAFTSMALEPVPGFDLDARLMTAAFSCDLLRVGSIHFPTHYDLEPVIGYAAGMFGTSDSHDLTHKTNNESAPLWNNPDAMAMIKRVHVEQATMFARLIDHLKSIPEPDGTTLLDHTVVLWCSQIAEGGHSVAQLPWILAGSAGGRFKTGRYLKYDRPNDQGPAHNALYVSLANAMGVMIDTFGEPSVSQGPLSRL
jgi:hypothetical protein